MKPEHQAVMDGNLLPPLHHQLHHILKVPKDMKAIRKNDLLNLLLPQWQLPRINQGIFEVPKHQFAWGCIIGVWPSKKHRELQVLEELQCLFGAMVRSVVQHYDAIRPPVLPLLVQLIHQLLEE